MSLGRRLSDFFLLFSVSNFDKIIFWYTFQKLIENGLRVKRERDDSYVKTQMTDLEKTSLFRFL